MKKKKKIVLVLAIISFFIFIGSTAYTYAKYFTKVDSSHISNIQKWEIIVNNENIKGNKILEKELELALTNNEHVATNNIAPGSEGYFYIDLDYTNTDLSFEYKIELDKTNTAIDDIVLSAEIINGPNNEFKFENNTISNNIIIDNTTTMKNQRIKVNVKWNDDPDTETMNNIDDTKVQMINDLITMNLKLIFTQIEN